MANNNNNNSNNNNNNNNNNSSSSSDESLQFSTSNSDVLPSEPAPNSDPSTQASSSTVLSSKKPKKKSQTSPSSVSASFPTFFDASKDLDSELGNRLKSQVTLALEKRGRKHFTLVEGLDEDTVDLNKACRLLRKELCAGAAVKVKEEDGTRFIEVQGSCQAETAKILKGMGWCDSVRRRG